MRELKMAGGREGKVEKDEVGEVEKEVMKAVQAIDPVNSTVGGGLSGKV